MSRDDDPKLCIVLSSVYPAIYYQTNESIRWNEEVTDDFFAVQRILSVDHEIIEIRIPVKMGKYGAKKLIRDTLRTSLLSRSKEGRTMTECHLVLNTHGIPGYYDLRHDVVLETIDFLLFKATKSLGYVKITQISALMCDGMAAQSQEDPMTRVAVQMRCLFEPTCAPRPLKEAAMVVLQQKLQALHCFPGNSQSFKILGFDRAYDPSEETAHVEAVLRGDVVDAVTELTVTIPPCDPDSVVDKKMVLTAIETVEAYRDPETKADIDKCMYEKAGNVLAKVVNVMRDEAMSYFSHNDDHTEDRTDHSRMEEVCPLLCNVLREHAKSMYRPTIAELDSSNFDRVYRDWLKSYKIYSKERLSLLKQFIDDDAESSFVCL